ncbi:DUF3515 domain-containing protein [Nocardioides jiangxiensis]|uniref:DUF3515 domain-containing protein n=1 Tax=Nocardioides jiangxiensis TaxID=3064524 RepID=A0ABT9B4B9_9ACTN|nr:DUF3515 domain-containing protein [Nocardioides sp. WY-20]MDO7869159.1 DUF3515 domain-containing protein [Nocardioides sp. WY-20]
MSSRSLVLPALTVAALLTGCGSDSVEIASTRVDAADRTTCQQLVRALPATLDHLVTRAVVPRTALGHAWGDPAVVLTCGVTMPADFQPGASCEEINGVGWFVPTEQFGDLSEDLTVYTIGRDPVVEVVIPAEHRRDAAFPGDALATLAAPVKQAIPKAERCV